MTEPHIDHKFLFRTASVLGLLLLVAALPRGRAERRQEAAPPAGAAPATVAKHASARDKTTLATVLAERYRVTFRLTMPSIQSFARASSSEREALARLVAEPLLTVRIDAVASRMLAILGAEHPAGPRELLLAEDLGTVTLRDPKQRTYVSEPLALWADLLDARGPSTRDDFEQEFPYEDDPTRPRRRMLGEPQGLHAEEIYSNIRMHYYNDPERPRHWPLRIGLRLRVTERAQSPADPAPQVLAVLLPQLVNERGLLVLESLAARIAGRPVDRARIKVENGERTDGEAPTWEASVERLGMVRLAQSWFEPAGAGYHQQSEREEFSRPAGRAAHSPQALAALRAAKTQGALEIHNQSRGAVLVLVDGARVGWVAGRSSFTFKGFPEGFYNVYAVSPTGTLSWGPKAVYIPGPITLR